MASCAQLKHRESKPEISVDVGVSFNSQSLTLEMWFLQQACTTYTSPDSSTVSQAKCSNA